MVPMPEQHPADWIMITSGARYETSFRVGPSFALPAVLRRLGQPPEEVFAEAGVDPEVYAHPENRIEATALGVLLNIAARRTARPDIALILVDGFRPEALGLVGHLAAEGPDVHTGLRNLVRLLQHNTFAGYPVLASAGPVAMMKFELRDPDFDGSEFVQEGSTGIIHRFLQWLCGAAWKPEIVHLCRRAPADPKPFQKFFDAPVRFSATEDAIFFSAEWLDCPVAREEQRRAAKRVQIAAAPYSELVRRQVAMRLGLASLRADDIAGDLGVSRRQLFRQLKSEGTTVQVLVDETRFSRARHLLAAGDAPLADIAFALGFPEQSAFTRAFARWSGLPPGEWRRSGKHDHRS